MSEAGLKYFINARFKLNLIAFQCTSKIHSKHFGESGVQSSGALFYKYHRGTYDWTKEAFSYLKNI